MKSLRDDVSAQERLAPTFVMAASFLCAIIVLTGLMQRVFVSASGAFENRENTDVLGTWSLEYVSPTAGYNITASNTTDFPFSSKSEHKLEYTVSDWDYLTVRIIRDKTWRMSPLESILGTWPKYEEAAKYDDFIFLHGKASGKDRWIAIPLYAFTSSSAIVEDNVSIVATRLLDTNVSVVLTTPSNAENHTALIWLSVFNMRIAIANPENAVMRGSMWTILWQIMSMQLPNTDPLIRPLLATPYWAAMGFMVFTILSRVIPFISGG